MPWGESVRPFVDVRAAYSYLSDMYAMPGSPFALSGNDPTLAYVDAGRRSRGFGGVAGAGFEYSLTHSIALTTELTATRARMTTYRLIGAPTLPNDRSYWMTMTRWSLGLKFNPVHALNLAQNPRS
jgi:hypothetical protein